MKKHLTIVIIGLVVMMPTQGNLFAVSLPGVFDVSEARVLKISGVAEFRKAGDIRWDPLTKDSLLHEGDMVKTFKATQVVLEFYGNQKTAEVIVRESTEFVFNTFRHTKEDDLDNTLLDVSKGSILIKAEKLRGESTFEVKTPTTTAGVRGTIFEVNVEDAVESPTLH